MIAAALAYYTTVSNRCVKDDRVEVAHPERLQPYLGRRIQQNTLHILIVLAVMLSLTGTPAFGLFHRQFVPASAGPVLGDLGKPRRLAPCHLTLRGNGNETEACRGPPPNNYYHRTSIGRAWCPWWGFLGKEMSSPADTRQDSYRSDMEIGRRPHVEFGFDHA